MKKIVIILLLVVIECTSIAIATKSYEFSGGGLIAAIFAFAIMLFNEDE